MHNQTMLDLLWTLVFIGVILWLLGSLFGI
jgi:hypothetical protein